MGKKKNSMFDYASRKNNSGGRKDDDEKKGRSKEAEDILSRSKPTLSKHDSAVIRAAMSRPAKLGDEASKFRKICNHQDGVIDLRKLDKIGVNRSYVPFLDQMLKMFGENKIAFCDRCYDVLVEEGVISVDDAWRAVCTLYAIANTVKANLRMNKKEITALSDLQETLVKEWAGVVKMFGDSIDKKTRYQESSDRSGYRGQSGSDNDVGALNQ